MKCPVCDKQVNNNGLHNHKVYRIRTNGVRARASKDTFGTVLTSVYRKVMVHAKCNDAYLVTLRLLEAVS